MDYYLLYLLFFNSLFFDGYCSLVYILFDYYAYLEDFLF